MVQANQVAVRRQTPVAVMQEGEAAFVQLTDVGIQNIKHNIEQAEKLVVQVLELDVDYGVQPGTDRLCLRDPGASKVMNAFQCRAEPSVLHYRDDDDLISWSIRIDCIHRASGMIVAHGVGSCSTNESKYGFRWVEDPEKVGVDRAGLKTREKTKKGVNVIEYRIPNPEVLDLGNTILKMATKRSEVDCAENLPGVSSALRKLFDPKLCEGLEGGQEIKAAPDFKRFWSIIKGWGKDEAWAHTNLSVASLKDWLEHDLTLDDAIIFLGKLAMGAVKQEEPKQKQAAPAPAAAAPVSQPAQKAEPAKKAEPTKKPTLATKVEWDCVTQSQMIDYATMESIIYQLSGMQPAEVYKQLGVTCRRDLCISAWEGFLTIKNLKHPKDPPPE